MCGVERNEKVGYCGETDCMRVAKIMLHHWEEPCISGGPDGSGSGAVFFSGCSLRCVYCQNKKISRSAVGNFYTPTRLAEEIMKLQEAGAYNINFVTPTHFTSRIKETLDLLDGKLKIPVVWNTSGYERQETISSLKPYVDIFLTDMKYFSSEMSARYSGAADCFDVSVAALSEMVKITGAPRFEGDLLKSGVIIRHLVLPGGYKDSIKILETITDRIGTENIVLSLMSQYTPEFLTDEDEGCNEIRRRVTTFEYNKVLTAATDLGFTGFMQERSSATSLYTPDF